MAAAPEAAPAEQADEPDHVAVQLDALSGMVERQGQALSPAADAAPDAPIAAEVPAPPAVTSEEPAAIQPQQADAAEPAPTEPDEASTPEEIDPLTAPLSALTGAGVPPVSAEAATAEVLAPPVQPAPALAAPATAPELPTDVPTDVPTEAETPGGTAASSDVGTAGRSAAIVRPAQLLIVATAVLNLILVGLNAVLGAPTGSMAMVVLGVALITLATWTGAAVTFLHWVSRAHAHVAVTAASRQRHGQSMSLIGWFIPIAGFVIGYRVLQDLWTGSDPTTRGQADAGPANARSIDIWLLGIVTAGLFGYVMPLALGASALWGGLSALGFMVASLSLASAIGAISAWQVETGTSDEATGTTEAVAEAQIRSVAPTTPQSDESSNPAPAAQPVAASAE